ncbi:non-homologous end-joining DNA ligase [Candidatus Dependentiae bacterium]|nr:non-homologous end-joining DNA ligase [Candidatus Dependentiae bacterium]MCC7414981.1 non-homologous end-joining DNA ligase [Campylobacterota bacterium]
MKKIRKCMSLMSKKKLSVVIGNHTIELSSFDKVLFPKSGITKGDVVVYYQKIAPFFLAHARDHLMVMHRFPDGIDAPGFYQKEVSDYFPPWIARKKIILKDGTAQSLVVLDSTAALVYLANQAVLVFHSWLSTQKATQKPDKIVFDVDPSGNSLAELRFAVRTLKKVIEGYGLQPFLMATGSRSYHVVVPIRPQYTYAQTRAFAKRICSDLVDAYPERFTIALSKAQRKGRIFLDYLRNAARATSVACYSLRALEGASIATPLSWDELTRTKPQQYTIKNIFKRLARKKDPWHDFAQRATLLPLPKCE